jgi:hypothetical protein
LSPVAVVYAEVVSGSAYELLLRAFCEDEAFFGRLTAGSADLELTSWLAATESPSSGNAHVRLHCRVCDVAFDLMLNFQAGSADGQRQAEALRDGASAAQLRIEAVLAADTPDAFRGRLFLRGVVPANPPGVAALVLSPG